MAPTKERIVALDALRGLAMLGILAVHVQLFAMPVAARFNPTVDGDLAGANGLVWLATAVLADGKFIAIFAMLFGAGIVLQTSRDADDRSAAATFYRRMTALFVVGALHAYGLWYGDMLLTFAVCGALVFVHRDRSAAALITAGAIALAVVPLLSAVLASMPSVLAASSTMLAPSRETLANEIAAYRGGWLQQQAHRVPTAWELHTSSFAFRGIWQTGGLMLLGMGLVRTRALTGDLTTRWYALVATVGFGAGIPLVVWSEQRAFATGWDLADFLLVGIHGSYWGNLLVGIGWIGLTLALHRLRLIPRAVVAVGRTALSNYLFATLICTTVFYGHGFGLFGSIDRVGQLGIVIAVWTLQLALSTWWLRAFTMGPFEWLIRSATVGRGVRLRLTTASQAP